MDGLGSRERKRRDAQSTDDSYHISAPVVFPDVTAKTGLAARGLRLCGEDGERYRGGRRAAKPSAAKQNFTAAK